MKWVLRELQKIILYIGMSLTVKLSTQYVKLVNVPVLGVIKRKQRLN